MNAIGPLPAPIMSARRSKNVTRGRRLGSAYERGEEVLLTSGPVFVFRICAFLGRRSEVRVAPPGEGKEVFVLGPWRAFRGQKGEKHFCIKNVFAEGISSLALVVRGFASMNRWQAKGRQSGVGYTVGGLRRGSRVAERRLMPVTKGGPFFY